MTEKNREGSVSGAGIENTLKGKPLFENWLLPILAFAGLFAVFSPAIYHMARTWRYDPYYSHGFLVPLISIVLLWTLRSRLAASVRINEIRSILFLAVIIGFHVTAFLADFRSAMYLALVLSIVGLVHFMWGKETLKVALFPLLYLLLMIPLPYTLTSSVAFPMQLISSKYAAAVLQVMNISALQEGVNIHIPGYSFIIEEGCSGLNSVVALFTLAVLIAHLVGRTTGRKIFLAFSAIPIALLANLLRIVTVILVARFFGTEVAESFFHQFSSLFLFSIAFLLLIGTAGYIGCLQKPS